MATLVVGKHTFGKCDVVPEILYVTTWFYHVNYLPLLAHDTRVVIVRNGKHYDAAHVVLSFKSILLAWARALSVIAFAACCIWLLITYGMRLDKEHRDLSIVLPMAAWAVSFGLMLFTVYFPVKASYQRACELAVLAKLNETEWAALNVLFGRAPTDRPPDYVAPPELAEADATPVLVAAQNPSKPRAAASPIAPQKTKRGSK